MAKKNILIVGMARSGTSLASSIFARNGYHVGNIANEQFRDGDANNPFGYFEADDLIEKNIELFQRAGFHHHNTWKYEHISAESIAALAQMQPTYADRLFLQRYQSHSPWMWKDPRLCFTLAFWWKLLDPATTGVLLTVRNPEEIYRSLVRGGLYKRGASARDNMLKRAEQHFQVVRAAVDELGIPHITVDYSEYFDQPDTVAKRIGKFCGLSLSSDELNVHKGLNHSRLKGRILTWVRVQLRKIPRRSRKWLQNALPRRLISILFPEWKFVAKKTK